MGMTPVTTYAFKFFGVGPDITDDDILRKATIEPLAQRPQHEDFPALQEFISRQKNQPISEWIIHRTIKFDASFCDSTINALSSLGHWSGRVSVLSQAVSTISLVANVFLISKERRSFRVAAALVCVAAYFLKMQADQLWAICQEKRSSLQGRLREFGLNIAQCRAILIKNNYGYDSYALSGLQDERSLSLLPKIFSPEERIFLTTRWLDEPFKRYLSSDENEPEDSECQAFGQRYFQDGAFEKMATLLPEDSP
jgi:hypothetical protein